jgi:hypothetical protein
MEVWRQAPATTEFLAFLLNLKKQLHVELEQTQHTLTEQVIRAKLVELATIQKVVNYARHGKYTDA